MAVVSKPPWRSLTGSVGERFTARKGTQIATAAPSVCYVGGEDLDRWMVEQGWAVAFRKYSLDYMDAESDAREARRSIWQGEFDPPWGLASGASPPLLRRVGRDSIAQSFSTHGHTVGLGHWPDPKCVMYFSNSLADTDSRGSSLCATCARKRKRRSWWRASALSNGCRSSASLFPVEAGAANGKNTRNAARPARACCPSGQTH
jgi:hypothetical protein